MSLQSTRPDARELMFHLFGRSIHPELFDIYAETEINQDNYSAILRICDSGHMISFNGNGQTITELTAARKHPLPQKKRFLEKKLRGCRDESIRMDNGVSYQVSYQLEQLDPQVFLNIHEEFLADCERADVAHRFPGGNRLAPCPISLIRTDLWPTSMLIHAFHTFPEDCVVVKTQSLIEL